METKENNYLSINTGKRGKQLSYLNINIGNSYHSKGKETQMFWDVCVSLYVQERAFLLDQVKQIQKMRGRYSHDLW